MADFACPGCGRGLKVKGEAAGRKGKCPHCGHALTVPAAAGAGPSPRQAPSGTEAPTLPAPTPAEEARRDTHGDPDATGGAAPPSDLTDFLAPPQGPGEIGRLGPYRILEVLGTGGMGVVYRAEDPHLQRQVAVKVMMPSLAASRSARERFLREARAAAAVENDHVVAIYQVGEDRGVPYLAMPLLRGESLDDRLKREGALPLREALRVGREAAAGLEAARKRGLIHRDIKPANLWLEEETGRVKILDFGLARAAGGDAGLTQEGAILGTPAYMAPEQAGGTADHRSDLFSLGCVLYRMATGQAPFKGTDTISTLMAVATEEPAPPHEVKPGLPRALTELVMRMLAKKPEGRPASARAVVEAIRAIESDPTRPVPVPRRPAPKPAAKAPARGAAKPVPVKPAASPRNKRKGAGILWIGTAFLSVLALLALAAGAYVLTRPPDQKGKGGGEQPVVKGDGWQPLFNDRDLSGWAVGKGNKYDNWGVGDDILFTTGAKHNWLLTDKEYGDFELRLEYKLSDGANSGVGLRAEPDDEPLEVQLIDEAGWVKSKGPLRPAELNGALVDLMPPSGSAAHPAGEWTALEVAARGSIVTVKIRDVIVLQTDLDRHKRQAARFPGLTRPKGRIGLQSHTGRVEFRRLFVRPLATDEEPGGFGGTVGGGGVLP